MSELTRLLVRIFVLGHALSKAGSRALFIIRQLTALSATAMSLCDIDSESRGGVRKRCIWNAYISHRYS